MHSLGAQKGAAGGPHFRKSGGPELRKSGGPHPKKSGGSDQRKFCNQMREQPAQALVWGTICLDSGVPFTH